MPSSTCPIPPSRDRSERLLPDRRLPEVTPHATIEATRALPTLSAVVPNYNHARYLGPALEALLSQSAPLAEIIVVDDASTDDSCALVERLAAGHPQLRLIRQPRNAGVNAALNRGLAEATGEYICFPAADDLVGVDFAGRSLTVLARHPEAPRAKRLEEALAARVELVGIGGPPGRARRGCRRARGTDGGQEEPRVER